MQALAVVLKMDSDMSVDRPQLAVQCALLYTALDGTRRIRLTAAHAHTHTHTHKHVCSRADSGCRSHTRGSVHPSPLFTMAAFSSLSFPPPSISRV